MFFPTGPAPYRPSEADKWRAYACAALTGHSKIGSASNTAEAARAADEMMKLETQRFSATKPKPKPKPKPNITKPTKVAD